MSKLEFKRLVARYSTFNNIDGTMALELKLRKIGDSVGFALPKEVLNTLGVGEGDSVMLTLGNGGSFNLSRPDSGLNKMHCVVQDLMNRYDNTLRELAKSERLENKSAQNEA